MNREQFEYEKKDGSILGKNYSWITPTTLIFIEERLAEGVKQLKRIADRVEGKYYQLSPEVADKIDKMYPKKYADTPACAGCGDLRTAVEGFINKAMAHGDPNLITNHDVEALNEALSAHTCKPAVNLPSVRTDIDAGTLTVAVSDPNADALADAVENYIEAGGDISDEGMKSALDKYKEAHNAKA